MVDKFAEQELICRVAPLTAKDLMRACDAHNFDLHSTSELDGSAIILGQDRALEAVDFGSRIAHSGFNLFVMSPPGTGAKDFVRRRLASKAARETPPADWVYVNNFDAPNRPIALKLPPGRSIVLRDSMNSLIDDLSASLPAVFESEDYRNRRQNIDDEFQTRQEQALKELDNKAMARNAAILRTPMGWVVTPLKKGKVIKPDEFERLSPEDQKLAKETIAEIQDELEQLLGAVPKFEKERRESIRKLDEETAMLAIGQSIEEITKRFSDLPEVLIYIDSVRKALIKHTTIFMSPQTEGTTGFAEPSSDGRFEPFTVNVIVTHGDRDTAAPLVHEDHPTLQNLIGRIEHIAHQGALITNFTLIQSGALHRANGGYLLLDARQVFSEPFAWAALKRALRTQSIRIKGPAEYLGFASTVSLEPASIPLDIKVVIFGERLHYYLLLALDPEMRDLFKVVADFEEVIDRTPENECGFAELLRAICEREKLHPLDRSAIGRMIEHASRQAQDAGKLSLEIEPITDRLREADFLAREEGRSTIVRSDIVSAINAETRRTDRVRDYVQESILREIALIETEGSVVGQINAISVSQIGDFRFGRPTRITARVGVGAGKVVDIEREVELGGPIHSKGVLILSGYLSTRYALDLPTSLAATLVFEQSYGAVEGDSASCAELFALLSAISEVPLRQDLAVTGSVNQRGIVQAIGGVNEKVEGFFDICARRGLSRRQGVLIPRSNVQHLMLREDVIEACTSDQFAVYTISTVDDGIALMTGKTAGDRQPDGKFATGTLNRLVEDKLAAFAQTRRNFGQSNRDNHST